MKEQKSLKQQPLMYISQPQFPTVPAQMQAHYSGRKNDATPNELVNHTENTTKSNKDLEKKEWLEKKIRKVAAEDILDIKKEKKVENNEPIKSEEPKEPLNQGRKRFRDFSIIDKVKVLISPPLNMPKSTCKIVTNNETITGKFNSIEQDIVTIRTLQSPYKIEIQIDEIQDIQIIGLR